MEEAFAVRGPMCAGVGDNIHTNVTDQRAGLLCMYHDLTTTQRTNRRGMEVCWRRQSRRLANILLDDNVGTYYFAAGVSVPSIAANASL